MDARVAVTRWLLATLILGVATSAAADPPTPEIAVTPSVVDLGPRVAGSSVETEAWVVNTGPQPVTLGLIRTDSLAVQATADRRVVAPGTAARLAVTVGVPEQPGAERRWNVVVPVEGTDAVRLPILVEPTTHGDPLGGHPIVPSSLAVIPGVVDLGAVAPSTTHRTLLWIVNSLDEPLGIEEARSSCGCLALDGFEPVTLPPRGARRLTATMTAPAEVGSAKRGRITFITTAGELARGFVWIEAVDPLVARVHAYRVARKRGDEDAVRGLLADDSRVWFGSREGPGAPRASSGDGPWAGWDRELGQVTTSDAFEVDGRAVSCMVSEVNDYYRLLERPAARYRMTYWFDDDDRIEGTLVSSVGGPTPPGRRDEFMSWARRHRAGVIASLLDAEGQIVPSAANARQWRRLLIEWRRDAGLPIPPLPQWHARLDRTLQTALTAPDFETFRSTLADDFRLWFEAREGPGLDVDAVRGLFEWDRVCNARLRQEQLTFDGDTATGVFHETNDFAELLGFPGWSSRNVFRFDEHGRLAEQLYVPLPGPSFADALEPALQWLRANRPDELAAVYVDGRIVHDADSARSWLRLLREWREATSDS